MTTHAKTVQPLAVIAHDGKQLLKAIDDFANVIGIDPGNPDLRAHATCESLGKTGAQNPEAKVQKAGLDQLMRANDPADLIRD